VAAEDVSCFSLSFGEKEKEVLTSQHEAALADEPSPLEGEGGPKGRVRGAGAALSGEVASTPLIRSLSRPPSPSRGEGKRGADISA
jgi:hypothetical protein